MRTKNQEYFAKIEQFIEEYAAEYGRSPTIREVAEEVGMSVTNAQRYIQDMKDRGILSSQGTRGLRTPAMIQRRANPTQIPILSSMYAVPCGGPSYAEQQIEGYVTLPAAYSRYGDCYFLPTEGDSMVNAGIASGDYVLVRHQNYAEPGQIVVALIGDSVTLKRYFPEPKEKRIRLQPENDAYEPIYVKECIIQGVVLSVMKDLTGGSIHGEQ